MEFLGLCAKKHEGFSSFLRKHPPWIRLLRGNRRCSALWSLWPAVCLCLEGAGHLWLHRGLEQDTALLCIFFAQPVILSFSHYIPDTGEMRKETK